MDAFTCQYIKTALWSSTDNDGEPLDGVYDASDLAPECLAAMQSDCADFQESFGELIADNIGRAGHDFWLTRNRHGAGFWDGDWPTATGKHLTQMSHAYGECNLYVGDDGLIHCA